MKPFTQYYGNDHSRCRSPTCLRGGCDLCFTDARESIDSTLCFHGRTLSGLRTKRHGGDESTLASAAALDVLRHGGNAIDAAVTAAAVLSVTEPHMTGIGGDMFALVWLAKEQKLVALNASGRAGARMTRDALMARGFEPGLQQGVESITVPGALAGWEMLVRSHGKRTLAAALQPAIRYARDGYAVTPIIASQWASETSLLMKDSTAAATFLPGGRAPKAGEWFRNPDYARTLETIATSGIGTFYGGVIGSQLVSRLDALHGFITLDDMKRNQPTWVTPISVPFKGFRVWELPPNNQELQRSRCSASSSRTT